MRNNHHQSEVNNQKVYVFKLLEVTHEISHQSSIQISEQIEQTYLELSKDAYEDASVKCGLRVACGDAALYLLEREAGHLLHDLRRTLHLLTLKSHQRLLRL